MGPRAGGEGGDGVENKPEARRPADARPPRQPVGIAGVTSGTVTWLDAARGHGAIAGEQTMPWDIWFHVSCVDGGERPLAAGDRVEVRYLRLDLDRFKYVAHLVRVIEPRA